MKQPKAIPFRKLPREVRARIDNVMMPAVHEQDIEKLRVEYSFHLQIVRGLRDLIRCRENPVDADELLAMLSS